MLTQCFNAHAENLLSESDKLDFRLKMKEYACKIYYPDLRNANPAVFKRDIENLQKNILKKISKSSEYYNEYAKFINDTPSISAAFTNFNKSIQQKNKFEMLEKQTQSMPYNVPKINNLNSQKYKPTLAEKMLFEFNYNTNSKDTGSNVAKVNPETIQKYQNILNEFKQIDDVETLKQKGPAIIAQSEDILTSKDEELDSLTQVENLVTISGLCSVRLSIDWEGTDTPTIKKHVIEYIKRIYEKATVIRYKYFIGLAVSHANEGLDLYGEAFIFCYKMKEELINKLCWDDKTELLLKIADELTRKCSKDELYMKISVSCYRLYVQEVDNDPNSDTQNKIIKKLQTLIYGLVSTYELYEKYIEAISVLDEVITAPDCPDFIKLDAEEKKKILQELVKIKINVKFGNKFMGNDGWKVIDKPYKYIGAYIGDSVRLTVEMETPPDVQINFDSIDWYGENVNSGDQKIDVSYEKPGKKEINLEVTVFDKKITRLVKVYVIEKPSGMSDIAFLINNPDESFKAVSKNLISSPAAAGQLEPSKWAAETYKNNGAHNGIQDAARHVYWNCLLVRYFGKDYAKGITDGHEVNTPSDLFTEVIMDLHNNEQGRQVAGHVHNSGNDYSCCRDAVTKSISNGQPLCFDDLVNLSKDALLMPTNQK